ncbi:MAG: transcriptional regulator, TrmB, partial [uncultured bacterium]
MVYIDKNLSTFYTNNVVENNRQNMEIEQYLSEFGLNSKEIQVYLATLELGASSVQQLSEKTGLKRTSIYDQLESLKKMGLVSEALIGKKTKFTANDPERLKDQVRRKSLILEALLPQLKALHSVPGIKPKIHYFEGAAGIRAALEDTMTAKDKMLFGILSMEDLYDVVGESYMEDYVQRRIAQGFSLRVIRSKEKEIAKRWFTNKKEHREKRYAPKGFVFAMTQYIYDNKVLLMSTKKENFAMIIESEDFMKNQRALF